VQRVSRASSSTITCATRACSFPIDPVHDALAGGMAATRASAPTRAATAPCPRRTPPPLTFVLADVALIRTSRRARNPRGYDPSPAFSSVARRTLRHHHEVTLRLYGHSRGAWRPAVCSFDTLEGARQDRHPDHPAGAFGGADRNCWTRFQMDSVTSSPSSAIRSRTRCSSSSTAHPGRP